MYEVEQIGGATATSYTIIRPKGVALQPIHLMDRSFPQLVMVSP